MCLSYIKIVHVCSPTFQSTGVYTGHSPSERPWRYWTDTAAVVTAVQEPANTTSSTGAVEPTRSVHAALHTSGTADETAGGEVTRQSVTFGGIGSGPGQFARPTGVVVSSTSKIFVADYTNHRVQVHNMDGAYVRHFPTAVPRMAGEIMLPHDIAIDCQDNLWVVGTVVFVGHRVVQYNRNGQGLTMFKIQSDRFCNGIAVDLRNDRIVVASQDSGKVEIFQSDGSLVGTFGENFSVSRNIAVNIKGNILMSYSSFVHVYNGIGQFLFSFGGRGSLASPRGICTDSSGHVLVADRKNKRVSMFTSHGRFVRHVANGLKTVNYVAVGPEGQLVVTNTIGTITIYPSYR
ncbi:tripartite motif-containing protein 3-like [Branchiostoma lanceolatum]|uniref:tripartite motif-containing protein 3-like n=1 Tax=Branchiostoma lanceolatum TaxID=7740 RepID=UPI00345736F7